MRISDWSSDVCSSDLIIHRPEIFLNAEAGAEDDEIRLSLDAVRGHDPLGGDALDRVGDQIDVVAPQHVIEAVVDHHPASEWCMGWQHLREQLGIVAGLLANIIGHNLAHLVVVFRSEEHTSELQSLM